MTQVQSLVRAALDGAFAAGPMVGQVVTVRGQDCRIVRVLPMGAIEVVTLDGSRAYRLSGLPL